jgi:hypothetical protein
VQVINGAFPARIIGPEDAIEQMEAACYTG